MDNVTDPPKQETTRPRTWARTTLERTTSSTDKDGSDKRRETLASESEKMRSLRVSFP